MNLLSFNILHKKFYHTSYFLSIDDVIFKIKYGKRKGLPKCGGDEENRTPVRKSIHKRYSECSL